MSHDAEMDAAMARIGVLRFRLDEAEAELTDLKSTADRFEVENSILMKETARLMADVEHLTSENLLVREEADRYCRLWQKAQVEVESLMTSPTSRLLRAERDENARLKERHDFYKSKWDEKNNQLVTTICIEQENARLKAEVERLEKTEDYLQNTLNQYALDDMRLQAEVERLRKAGDDMAKNLTHIGWNICVDAWNAAKEGKQS
jgi:chromosome segregation ATPase